MKFCYYSNVPAMKSIPFLLSINFCSNQVTLKVLFYLIGFGGRHKIRSSVMVGYTKQRKEGEKEKNSCGDMISEIRNKAQLGS